MCVDLLHDSTFTYRIEVLMSEEPDDHDYAIVVERFTEPVPGGTVVCTIRRYTGTAVPPPPRYTVIAHKEYEEDGVVKRTRFFASRELEAVMRVMDIASNALRTIMSTGSS